MANTSQTAATLTGFVQAMVLYPEVQKKAQSELDRVCGNNRLPTIDDWHAMPYIRACIKENLRWMPTTITGFPHCVIQDDEYMGYKIPKGAGVMCKLLKRISFGYEQQNCCYFTSMIGTIPLCRHQAPDFKFIQLEEFADKHPVNVWALNMDANRYSNPRAFDPSRYEGDDQTSAEAAMNGDTSKRDHFNFGAGRRVCQGMHIADRSLFLSISRLLWAFNIEKGVDSRGVEIVPDPDDLTGGILMQPSPFPAKITPRSKTHEEAIRRAWDDCQPLLDDTKQWKEVPDGMVFKTHMPSELKD